MTGHYRMARGWMDHEIFDAFDDEDPTYSERCAWIWLIEQAAWKRGKVGIDRKPVMLERGELSFSERFLATKWKWSRSRVHRFLGKLATWDMIGVRTAPVQKADHQSDRPQNILTICNYDKYQATPTVSEPSLNHTRTIREPKKKEGKEGKKGNNPPTPQGGVIDLEFEVWWREAPRKVGKGQAQRAYRSARKKAEAHALLAGIKAYAATRAGEDERYTVHPATWLNGERWLDAVAEPAGPWRDPGPTGPPPRPEDVWPDFKAEGTTH